MARRGQGQTKPSNEELIGKLREKIDEVRTENESKYGEITDLKKTMETLNSKIDTISEKLHSSSIRVMLRLFHLLMRLVLTYI